MYLISVISILFHYANAQTANYNFDFEDWYMDSLAEERLDQWEHIGWNDHILSQLHGTEKTTQSYSGNYAVTIHRWYMVGMDALRLRHATSQKPNYLNGFYIYTDATLAVHPDSSGVDDIAIIAAYFTKWNTVLGRSDTIGYAYQEVLAATGYTPFSCAITYTSVDQPDSFNIYIRPSKFLSGIGCKTGSDCSFLTVDNLSFSNTTSINDAHVTNNQLSIYPNPGKEELFIKAPSDVIIQKMYLVDMMGRVMMTQEGNTRKINVGYLSPGSYFLKLQTDDELILKKVAIE